jgi:hypothetical protein
MNELLVNISKDEMIKTFSSNDLWRMPIPFESLLVRRNFYTQIYDDFWLMHPPPKQFPWNWIFFFSFETQWQPWPNKQLTPPNKFHWQRVDKNFTSHNEPAPISAPSTRCLLWFGWGWSSTKLLPGFILVTHSIRSRSKI